jgi:hypothetical protein
VRDWKRERREKEDKRGSERRTEKPRQDERDGRKQR